MLKRTVGDSHRWIFALLIAAILLPTCIFAALEIGFSYRAERRAIEVTTLAHADATMAAIDGNIERTRASALALATATSIKKGNWPDAYKRAREIAALNADWRTVRLIDLDRQSELFDLSRPFGPPRPLSTMPVVPKGKLAIGGIQRVGPDCPCIPLDVPIQQAGRVRYLLTVIIDPAYMQVILMHRASKDGTSAIVDRYGNFIARSRAYRERVGTPATLYVREAVKRGRAEIYRSVTYEGMSTYTASAISPLTGWSSHVAVPSAIFDAPTWGARIATIVAGIISLVLALGLGWFLLRVIATQRQADLRLQQAQRLETVGKMTGGVAHDFNNMLAIVMGSLDLAQRRLAKGNVDIERYIDNAMDGAKRAADLTRRLLAFSRRQSLAPVTTDINALLDGMRELLSRTISETVTLRSEHDPKLWPAFLDPGQFENAIVNLTVNARDAMPEGGTLTIRTENATLTAAAAEALDLAPGDYVRISVTDTGTGMSPDVIKQAFDPFFTTKEVGKGTGLGLSQIHGFFKQSGGKAQIRSRIDEGTTVELLLPRCHGAMPAPATDRFSTPAATPVPTGTDKEIILVAEDEDQVRRTNVEALRELGYSVCHASNGMEALKILQSQPGIRLLFTDIMMPGMNGRELAREARTRMPGLKLLFATGYEREDDTRSGEEDDKTIMLRKPFGFDQLARKVRSVLDS